MRYFKSILFAGAIGAAALFSAQAFATPAPITVDGVTFASGAYFQSNQLFENAVTGVGQELHGYGQVTAINGNTNFCSGCDLAFTFGGYTVTSINDQNADFSGGTVDFYVIPPGSFDASNPASAMSGTLFLSTAGHVFDGQNNYAGRTGTLLSTGSALDTNSAAGTGIGQLDAVGGDAFNYFNTNTIDDFRGAFADFVFTTDFGTAGCSFPNGPNTQEFPICGSASLQGVVPEPGQLGMMGLGLVAAGFFVSRRRRTARKR